MLTTSKAAARVAKIYLKSEDCRLSDLAAHCSRQTDLADYPFAADVQKNVLI